MNTIVLNHYHILEDNVIIPICISVAISTCGYFCYSFINSWFPMVLIL